MSFRLFNKSGNILKSVATTTHENQSFGDYSLIRAAKEDSNVEAHDLPSGISRKPGYNIGYHSGSGNRDPDLEELHSSAEVRGSYGIGGLGSLYMQKKLEFDGLYPASVSLKADKEESDSESEGSDSAVEELVSEFASPFYISSEYSAVRAEEHKVKEKSQNLESNTFSHTIDPEPSITASPNLKAALPFPGSCESSVPQGSVLTNGSQAVVSGKLKSALRGGYERSGLGPRPKFHVTWAPDVHDPVWTSASHTVSQKSRRHHPRKNDHKHRQKGKASHSDSHKKSDRKLSRKSKDISEALIVRTLAIASQKGRCGVNLHEVGLRESYLLPCDEHALKNVKLSSIMLPQKSFPSNQMLQLGDRRLAKLDARMPISWHVQTHKFCM